MFLKLNRHALTLVLAACAASLAAGSRSAGDDFTAFREKGDAQRAIAKAFLELGSGQGNEAAIDFNAAHGKNKNSFGAELGTAMATLRNDGWPNRLEALAETPTGKLPVIAPLVAYLIKGKDEGLDLVSRLACLAARRCDDAQRRAESGDFEGALKALDQALAIAPWYLDAAAMKEDVTTLEKETAALKAKLEEGQKGK
jgi:hypothetical protein